MNPDKILKFNNKTQKYHILDGILADHFALNIIIMELSENNGTDIEFPSDIEQYNDNIKKLQTLYSLCLFDSQDYIMYLINNDTFKRESIDLTSELSTSGESSRSGLKLTVDNLDDFIDELLLTEIDSYTDFEEALSNLPGIYYDQSIIPDLWEKFKSIR